MHMVSTEDCFKKHLPNLEQVVTRLSKAGLKVFAEMGLFARTNLEYLGYNIGSNRIHPSQKMI